MIRIKTLHNTYVYIKPSTIELIEQFKDHTVIKLKDDTVYKTNTKASVLINKLKRI